MVATPSVCSLLTEAEKRSFDFFRLKTAPQLAGYFDGSFWEIVIPQASQKEPIFRHAILALGSLHERLERYDTDIQNSVWHKTEGGFALHHYNCAIGHLIKPKIPRPQYADVCLISCILFACFEAGRKPSYLAGSS